MLDLPDDTCTAEWKGARARRGHASDLHPGAYINTQADGILRSLRDARGADGDADGGYRIPRGGMFECAFRPFASAEPTLLSSAHGL